jgi:hypothetical protein
MRVAAARDAFVIGPRLIARQIITIGQRLRSHPQETLSVSAVITC